MAKNIFKEFDNDNVVIMAFVLIKILSNSLVIIIVVIAFIIIMIMINNTRKHNLLTITNKQTNQTDRNESKTEIEEKDALVSIVLIP